MAAICLSWRWLALSSISPKPQRFAACSMLAVLPMRHPLSEPSWEKPTTTAGGEEAAGAVLWQAVRARQRERRAKMR